MFDSAAEHQSGDNLPMFQAAPWGMVITDR
jgi:hypothetical protein